MVTTRAPICLIVPFSASRVPPSVTLRHFHTNRRAPRTPRHIVVRKGGHTRNQVHRLTNVVSRRSKLVKKRKVRIHSTRIRRTIVVRVTHRVLSRNLHRFNGRLTTTPFTTLSVCGPLIATRVMRIGRELNLSTSTTTTSACPFTLSPNGLRHPLRLPMENCNVGRVTKVLVRVGTYNSPSHRIIIVHTMLTKARLKRHHVKRTTTANRF